MTTLPTGKRSPARKKKKGARQKGPGIPGLYTALAAHGWTVARYAKLIGYSVRYVQSMKQGWCTLYDECMIDPLFHVVGCTWEELWPQSAPAPPAKKGRPPTAE